MAALVFDFGMYDGEDARYYLETGLKVVAIDADPVLCEAAKKRFAEPLSKGQLVVEHAAISNTPGTIDLHVSGQDRGSSSIYADRIAERWPLGKYSVPTVTYDDLVAKHGKPEYLKIDIEGADRDAVMSLRHETAPPFLSFEAHEHLEEMIQHCYDLGYRRFKIINQTNFRCIQNQESIGHRLGMKLVRLAGYDKPLTRKINGRYHVLGHSAGPAPWNSDGQWYSRNEILAAWQSSRRSGWYDVHAATRTAEAPVSTSKAIGQAFSRVVGVMAVIGLIIAGALMIF